MNFDKLLDAIGMVDDDLLEEEKKTRTIPLRRRLTVLAAAVLIMALTIGAVAAEGDLQQWGQSVQELVQSAEDAFLKVFHIKTPDKPPESTLGPKPPLTMGQPNDTTAPDGVTQPTGSMLEYVTTVDIEGVVHAYYFAGSGYMYHFDKGFYTWPDREPGKAPEEATFWQITKDDIVDVGRTRLDFTLNHGGRDFRILFDYAVMYGDLCIMTWQEGMDENPYGNGWNAQSIGDRTDIVLLSIPVSTNRDYTHDYLILDLETLETTNLLEGVPVEGLVIDVLWLTADMRYALMTGYDTRTNKGTQCVCDLEENTITDLEAWTGHNLYEFYLLDDRTLIVYESSAEERTTVARYDIPTGERTVIVENVLRTGETGYRPIYSHGAGGVHGLLIDEKGTTWIIDLRTGERYSLAGLDMAGAQRIESPDGQKVVFGYRQKAVDEKTGWYYPKIGLLDPKTGEMKMLTRDVSGNAEYMYGFLDENTVVISSQMDENNGYYLYVYEFN